MAKLKDFLFEPPRPIQSQHHGKVKLNYPKVQDIDELTKRKNSDTQEWILWAIDKELLVGESRERLQVREHNFGEFFHEDTADLVREEFYLRHVDPFLENQKKAITKFKSLWGWQTKSPGPVSTRIENLNEKISRLDLTSPTLELQTTLAEATSTLSAIHDEAQRSNRSNSRKWWFGFGALVIFTFFGVNIQKLVDWFQCIWQWFQSILTP